MNAKALIPLLAGLGIGGLALVLGVQTLKSARAGQTVAKVKVWAAKEDVPRGTELKEEMLMEQSYPVELVPKGAFKKKDELVGRVPRLVAPGGLPILESMLSPPGTKPGIFVKPGYRAVAVKIDAGSGVDYHLEPGCFVDVVGSFKVKRNGRAETIARTIVENAEVAAVGPRVSPATGAEAPKSGKDLSQSVRAVTLFVKPEQVPKLLLTEQEGRIKLSMRGLQDTNAPEEERWASGSELTGETPSEPAPEAASASPLDWIRGLFAKPQAEPTSAPAVAAASPPAPALEGWILKIYRADKEEVLQFKNADSRERVDTAARGERGEVGQRGESAAKARAPAPSAAADNPPNVEPAPEPEESSE
jgi:pilus assembly protein CpaB